MPKTVKGSIKVKNENLFVVKIQVRLGITMQFEYMPSHESQLRKLLWCTVYVMATVNYVCSPYCDSLLQDLCNMPQ